MKYFLVQRQDDVSARLAERFHELAAQYGMQVDDKEPEVVVSIGGDGTMLIAFHQFIDKLDRISFVGIHTGHLGFFADWKPDQLDYLVQLMHSREIDQDLRIVQYPILEIEIRSSEGVERRLALNEFTLKGIENTLVAQVDINDEMFEMFRGDGICVSTPSGSTAYNKSLGGAIVHPSLAAIQIAEIASINNRVYRTLGSPMLLPLHHHCDIYPKSKHPIYLAFDYQYVERNDIEAIRCRVSPDLKVKFARYRPFPFWKRVREAFIGNDFQ
ncbi:NAD kinase [Paenibacillus sp. FJAT-26967]|uniref:NAD kinase n=1 Tax=Paenibacillus sp. FJAT-26967 TaxID=1729690 RepID=UPI0008397DFF|nr:NAD kinase [Paenibacillus sp. FJAT-26967]